MTSLQVELSVTWFFNPRRNIVVPNVSWGLGVHECDLMVITPAGYATEVEIKVSRSDLLADKKKRHQHKSAKIRRLFFAVPSELEDYALQNIPAHAGLLSMRPRGWGRLCELVRPAKINADARKLTPAEVLKVAHLGCMRIWDLKSTLHQIHQIRPSK